MHARLAIDKQGLVKDITILDSQDSLLVKEAVLACKNLTNWIPATVNKVPVDSIIEVEIPFDELNSDKLLNSGKLIQPYEYDPGKPIPDGTSVIHGRFKFKPGKMIERGNKTSVVFAYNKGNGKVYAIGVLEHGWVNTGRDFFAFLEPGDYTLLFYQYCEASLVDIMYVWTGIFKDKSSDEIQAMNLSPEEIAALPRYEFSVKSGTMHFVGEWDFSNGRPKFSNPLENEASVESKEKPYKVKPEEVITIPQ